jgi:hypothetical protein
MFCKSKEEQISAGEEYVNQLKKFGFIGEKKIELKAVDQNLITEESKRESKEKNQNPVIKKIEREPKQINPAFIGAFIKKVVMGKIIEAKVILNSLNNDHELHELYLSKKMDVTDSANREFSSITAFQYAVWIGDRHMWKMLQEYMPIDMQRTQFRELEKGITYTVNLQSITSQAFDFTPFSEALRKYASHCYEVIDHAERQKRHYLSVSNYYSYGTLVADMYTEKNKLPHYVKFKCLWMDQSMLYGVPRGVDVSSERSAIHTLTQEIDRERNYLKIDLREPEPTSSSRLSL